MRKVLIWLKNRRVAFFMILYVTTFVLILPTFYGGAHHSVYNTWRRTRQAERTRMLRENQERLDESRHVIEKYKHSMRLNDPPKYDDAVRVGISVVSMSRNGVGKLDPQYLTQVIGRLIHLVSIAATSRYYYDISVCNVDGAPANYSEATDLRILLPVFEKYTNNSKPFGYGSIFEKEKLDYVFCLEKTMERNVSFAFLIEDDAYPHGDMLVVLERIIDYIEYKRTNYDRQYPAFVKFYHPERLLGYINLFQCERVPELCAIGCVGGTLVTMIYYLIFNTKDRTSISKTWAFSVIFVCLVVIAIGRVNLLELRRVHPQLYQLTPTASCCTQAMLFPREGAQNIASHLGNRTCKKGYGKDIALEEIRVKEGYSALMVQPNLFSHIGLFSVLRDRAMNPLLFD